MASSRVAWVDVAKGICIIAVVSMYAVERVDELPGAGNWLKGWVRFARPFRMPDFFLISGLFLSRVIDRPWREYLDKKVVHYLYFFALWTVVDFPFLVLVGKAGAGPAENLRHLARLFYEPYAMLWFIQMLAVYFVTTRLLKKAPVPLVLLGALVLQMFPHQSGFMQVDHFGERFVYFYAGYAFAPAFFALADAARARPGPACGGLMAWALVNGALVSTGYGAAPGIGAALGFLGAGAVIATASLVADSRVGRGLSFLGERSIVIYLSFLIPLTALLMAAAKLGLPLDRGTLAALATAGSIAASLALGRAVRGTRLAFLFERPRWATLREPAPAAVPAVVQ